MLQHKNRPTLEEINRISSSGGKSATRQALASWGISWPPPNGWLKKLRREILECTGDEMLTASYPQAKKQAKPAKKPKRIADSNRWTGTGHTIMCRFGIFRSCSVLPSGD